MELNFRKSIFVFSLFLLLITNYISAQSIPVMYFCERYDNAYGEINVSDRFHEGYLTVMVKADKPLGLTKCFIQFDKLNNRSWKFEYFKRFEFTTNPMDNYIFFSKNTTADMNFDQSGIYRVFLLDAYKNTVTSALIEIIP